VPARAHRLSVQAAEAKQKPRNIQRHKKSSEELLPQSFFITIQSKNSDRAGNFTRTQATGAGVHSAGFAVDQRLNPLYVGFPGTVGTTMRMGYLDTKLNFFIAEIAFCHMSAPPLSNRKDYIITARLILQVFF
jgi:hypothetical protein